MPFTEPIILVKVKVTLLFLLGLVPQETAWIWPWSSRSSVYELPDSETRGGSLCTVTPTETIPKQTKKRIKFWLPSRRTAEEVGLISWHSHRSFFVVVVVFFLNEEGTWHGVVVVGGSWRSPAGPPSRPHAATMQCTKKVLVFFFCAHWGGDTVS